VNKKLAQRICAFALALALGISPGCAGKRIAQNPQSGRIDVQQQGGNAFSLEQEVQLGQQAAAQTEKELPILPESDPVSQYIRQLGQRLAAHTPEPKFNYTFKVVNQKEINAFALPGGPIYINVGTIQAADDEGELAGVMAHEISHIVLRHATSNATRQQYAALPLSILDAVLGGSSSTYAQLARLGLSFGAGSVFLKYSRDAEREADLLGAQIMYDAGYNPYSMAEFFAKLEQEGGSRGPEFLASHPDPGNRQQLVTQAVQKFPKKSFGRKDSPQFEQVKSVVAKMNPMTGEQIAQWRQKQQAQMRKAAMEQIRPSGSFQQLNHSAFSMGYPSNWEVFGDQKSAVTIAPKAGISQQAIAYGVVVSAVQPSPGSTLESVTRSLVNSIAESNPGTQVADTGQLNVSGMPAYSVTMRGPSPLSAGDGQVLAERDTLVTVQRPDGSVLFLVFIAPEQDMAALGNTYAEMLQSLQVR